MMTIRTTRAAIKSYMRRKLGMPTRGGFYRTLAGPKVFLTRFSAFQLEQLPIVSIFGTQETTQPISQTRERRILKVQFEIQAAGPDADLQIDYISDKIVETFQNDEYLGDQKSGLAERCAYKGGQLDYDERRHADIRCWVDDFEVSYIVETTPEAFVSEMDDFRSVSATYAFAQGSPEPPIVIETADQVFSLTPGAPPPSHPYLREVLLAFASSFADPTKMLIGIDIGSGIPESVDVNSFPTPLLSDPNAERDVVMVTFADPDAVLYVDNFDDPQEGVSFQVQGDGKPVEIPFANGQLWAIAKGRNPEGDALSSVAVSVRPVKLNGWIKRFVEANL